MDEKLICCQVCQVAYILSVPVLIFNQILQGRANTAPPATTAARQIHLCKLCQMFNVLLSLLREDLIKVEKFKDKNHPQYGDCCLAVWRERNWCGSGRRNRAAVSAPLAHGKFETWSHSANVLLHPPPHGCKHQVHSLSVSAISACAMLCCAYVLQ